MATEDEVILSNGLPLPTRQTRKQLVIATLIFCWLIIAYVVGFGKPDNSLHTSALAWAFASSMGVVFAYVFGAVFDNLNFLRAATNKLS